MATKSGFFNSVNGDRLYNAEDMSHYFEGIISNGVYNNVGNKFRVTIGDGLSVNIDTGRAIIDSHWFRNDTLVNIPLDPSDVQLDRYDAIVIKYDSTDRTINFEVIKGSNGSGEPAFSDTDKVKYLYLARVKVISNATVLTQSNIADRRGTSRCPWVTGVVQQVDTSDLFAQYEDATKRAYESFLADMTNYCNTIKQNVENWFNTLTETLTVDTALVRYQNSKSFTTEVQDITIDIPEYNSAKDVLFVNINGVSFVEGLDYTIEGTGSTAKIKLKNTIKGENTLTFLVLQSTEGYGAIADRLDKVNGEVI